MNKILLFVCIAVCLGCNNPQEGKAEENAASQSAVPQTACYAYTQNKDTVLLSLTVTGNSFTGNLLYQLKEKDRNKGTVQGSIMGDTLLADYTFSSEGMTSVRQVAFIKKENSLQEGFGEIAMNDKNEWVFSQPQALQFTGFVLQKVDCP